MISGNIKADRGFTLIELLVVIAIIGILSSVVLASLNTARTRGNAAAVKSNMATVSVQSELNYDTNGQYVATAITNGTCPTAVVASTMWDATTIQAVAAAEAVNGSGTEMRCNASTGASGAWAMSSALPGSTFWCIDSTGAKRQISATLAAGATVCPAS